MRTFTILSSVLSLIALSAPLAQAVVADGQKCDGRPNGDWACMSVPEGQAARNQFQCIGGVWHFERTCEFDDPATGFEDFCDAGPGTWKTAGGFTAAYCASEHHQE